jgi:polyamine oxidase
MTGHTRRDLLRLASAAGAGALLGGPLARMAIAASTQDYDDGNSNVPGGLIGDPERVIIVGAGWAGLTAANALRNAGVDHVVLDGRDRIGGRAHTVALGGVPVDLGCSWIHGPIGNPMAKFADQTGVKRLDGNVEEDSLVFRWFDDALARELTPAEKLDPLGYAFRFAESDSASIAKELGPRSSVRDGAQVYMDREGLQGTVRRNTEFLIRLLSEFVYGTDWSQMSLQYWSYANSESTYLGTGEGEFPEGGYTRLYTAMAGPQRVRLGHRVTAIDQGRRGVVVHAVAGKRRVVLRGSHVVVAVPLGVLKSGQIAFRPGLPAAKRAAIARVGVGDVEKVALVFDEPFWSDTTHRHMFYVSNRAPLEWPYYVDMYRTHKVPALVSFYGGPFAQGLRALNGDARLALTLDRLQHIMGRPIPLPRAVAETDWLNDRFSCGSYTAMRVGATPDDLDSIAAPVGGRVLFAGEATNRARHSTADGAMSTGFREAKRLLRRPAVAISSGA